MPSFTGVITEPGLYPDIPEDKYHRDPVPERSLSVSGAKLLVPPSPPAKYKHARDHGRLPTKAQRLGTLAHALTLGTPTDDISVQDFKDRTRTKAFIKAEEEAAAAGLRIVLTKEWDHAKAVADAVRTHPVAGGLLEGIEPEVSMFWRDEEFGIWLRGRMDGYTPDIWEMPTIVDLKSSKDASPDGFAKSVHDYGYFRQDPHYREGLAAALGCKWDEVDFVFVVVETEPPYLVATYRISDGTGGEYGQRTPDDVSLGREQNRIAREVYAACTESGSWPGYDEEITRLELRHYDRRDTEKVINEWYR